MIPVALDLSKISVLLIGRGEAFEKRKAQLEEAGVKELVCRKVLDAAEVERAQLVLVAGLDVETSQAIGTAVRAAGKLVNVEDVNDLCDFYYTSFVRRGDLIISVSTGGASPTLAKRVRDKIAHLFDERWEDYTRLIGEFRNQLRAQGKNMKQVAEASEEFLKEKGWFK